MVFRAYMLPDIADGKPGQVVRVLRDKPGVVMADLLEGPPDVIVVVEASERQKLAEFTIQALASVEAMTEDIQLLRATEKCDTDVFAALSSARS